MRLLRTVSGREVPIPRFKGTRHGERKLQVWLAELGLAEFAFRSGDGPPWRWSGHVGALLRGWHQDALAGRLPSSANTAICEYVFGYSPIRLV